jgi:predicted metal-dependent peptidase
MQRVMKARIAIMGHERYRAMAGVMMVGEWEMTTSVPRAATNGKDEMYNPDYIATLRDAQIRFLLLHENGHKMYRHLTTWQNLWKIDAELANKAADHFLNLRIKEDNKLDGFAQLVDNICCDEQFTGMGTLEIFKKLRKKKEEDGDDGGSGDGGGELDEHDWEGAQEMGEAEQKALDREIEEAMRQGQMAAGMDGSGGNRDIGELLTPEVDWHQQTQEFFNESCAGNDHSTWSRPNRRYMASGFYMPSGVAEQVGEIVMAIDMSSSTWRMVGKFWAELKALCEQACPQTLRIIYWDTKVAKEEVFTMDELSNVMNLIKPAGSGGTSIQCVPDYMAEAGIKPDCIVVLTDGDLFGDWGKGWNAPLLWCICNNTRQTPNVGKVVRVST